MKYDDLTKDDKVYLKGTENKAIRWYFYLNAGLNVLNQFRNLLIGVFAIYAFMKLDNVLWLPVMLLPCLPVLALLGWYQTHRMAKISEWLALRFSTHFGIKQFNYQEESTKLLQDIKTILENEKGGKKV
jgi:hypothetical protein